MEFLLLSRNKNYWPSLLDDNAIRLIYKFAYQSPGCFGYEANYLNEYNKNDDFDYGLVDDDEIDRIINTKYATFQIDYYKNGIFYLILYRQRIEGGSYKHYFARRAEDIIGRVDIYKTDENISKMIIMFN